MIDDAQFKTLLMVQFERVFPGPIERIWEFITDTQRLSGWFGDGSIEPRVGGSVKIMGGHIRGIVTQWGPPRRLTYTWNVFSSEEEESSYPESYLTFELGARANDCLLELTHLPILERFKKQNAMGWHTFLDMLGAAIRGEPLEPREVHMKRNAARYGVDLSNLER
jgi:uncharacterized protein YndB with AHSA1/START domain